MSISGGACAYFFFIIKNKNNPPITKVPVLMAMPPMLSDPAGVQAVPVQFPFAAAHAAAVVGTAPGFDGPKMEFKIDVKGDIVAPGEPLPEPLNTVPGLGEHTPVVDVPHPTIVAPPSAVWDKHDPSDP